VESEGVDHRLAAILSADVVGYSRLMAEDEAATVRTLSDYREEIGLLVRQHRGRVVDTAGDSLLAEFPTATEAVGCAAEIQGVLRTRNVTRPADRKMEFRIGIHLGEVRVEGERVYGDGVNIAARLEALDRRGLWDWPGTRVPDDCGRGGEREDAKAPACRREARTVHRREVSVTVCPPRKV
jgi:class 3 adenylate cyclase